MEKIMETTQFIDQLAAGEANQAKETLTDVLSAKAFEALENRKIEIAKSAFGGVEREQEQLDIEVLDANEINGVQMSDIEVQDTEDSPS
jgi:predicted flavoprotein YhiN